MNPTPSEALVAIRDLSLSFPGKPAGTWFKALDAVSLDIRPGEILGLVGESGSGKTTLGKAILRLHRPSSGSITIKGQDIAQLGERQLKPFRRDLQMIFQDPAASFNPRRTIGQALAQPLLTQRLARRAELPERIETLLRRVGLPARFSSSFPHELSGGQLQRVAIARALALAPALIVADEAVSKLDVSVRAGVLNLFKDIQAETGLSMLFITHDLEVARFLCHRIGVLYHGRLVEIGPAAEVFSRPLHPYTKLLLGTLDAADDGSGDIRRMQGVSSSGCRYLNTCPLAVDLCRERRPELEALRTGHFVACHRAGEWAAQAAAPRQAERTSA
jgi:oligopeptide/dipeptide ABC transporter ATP-binding protein